MELNKLAAIVALTVGIILIVSAIFYRNMLLTILCVSIIAFGILNIFNGWNLKNDIDEKNSLMLILLGIIVIVCGFSMIFIKEIPIKGFEFYVVGLVFIICSIIGFLSNINRVYDLSSIIVLAMGLFSISLNIFSLNNFLYLPIMIGIILIGESFALVVSY